MSGFSVNSKFLAGAINKQFVLPKRQNSYYVVSICEHGSLEIDGYDTLQEALGALSASDHLLSNDTSGLSVVNPKDVLGKPKENPKSFITLKGYGQYFSVKMDGRKYVDRLFLSNDTPIVIDHELMLEDSSIIADLLAKIIPEDITPEAKNYILA